MANNLFTGGSVSPGLYSGGSVDSFPAPVPSGTVGSSGLYVNDTANTSLYFEWLIFSTSDSAPSTPTGGTWNFSNNTGIPPTGWSISPPTTTPYATWMSIAIVDSRNPSIITWSVPGKILSNQQIYVSETPPSSPSVNDLWYDLGA